MEENLRRLGDFGDYEVADGEPDPRGWRVLSAEGQRIGDVDDLIVDTSAMKVRFLDCDLDESGLSLSGADRDRHVLIPVGHASLNQADREVRLGVNKDEVLNLPEYRGGALTAALASQVSSRFGGRQPLRDTRDTTRETRESLALRQRRPEREREGEQRMMRSEEEVTIDKRMVEAGEVGVRKHIETEHITRPVTRRREEVDIERRPVSGAPHTGRIGEEEEIRIPLREEEIVIEKHPEVKEEVVVRRRAVDEEVDVEADVRKERIEIERRGGTREASDRPIIERTEEFEESGGTFADKAKGLGDKAGGTLDDTTKGLGDQAGRAFDKAADKLRNPLDRDR